MISLIWTATGWGQYPSLHSTGQLDADEGSKKSFSPLAKMYRRLALAQMERKDGATKNRDLQVVR